MVQRIDYNALADYALNTFDFDELFEDDQWAVTFQGVRLFCERKRSHFNIHIGAEVLQLPR